jgi:hypothetical protein
MSAMQTPYTILYIELDNVDQFGSVVCEKVGRDS